MSMVDLHWLPPLQGGNGDLRNLAQAKEISWAELVKFANARLDFVQTNRLDKILMRSFGEQEAADAAGKPLRLAVLSSSTADHLVSALRIAGLRRNLRVHVHVGDYGQYLQELQDTASSLYKFRPSAVLFAFHAHHLFGAAEPGMSRADSDALMDSVAGKIRLAWRRARDQFKGQVIQQTII